jgi:hypothetical protein
MGLFTQHFFFNSHVSESKFYGLPAAGAMYVPCHPEPLIKPIHTIALALKMAKGSPNGI